VHIDVGDGDKDPPPPPLYLLALRIDDLDLPAWLEIKHGDSNVVLTPDFQSYLNKIISSRLRCRVHCRKLIIAFVVQVFSVVSLVPERDLYTRKSTRLLLGHDIPHPVARENEAFVVFSPRNNSDFWS
jgi:hypothetical protein